MPGPGGECIKRTKEQVQRPWHGMNVIDLKNRKEARREAEMMEGEVAWNCVSGPWTWGFPGGSVVKNSPAKVGDTGDLGSIPGSAGSPEEVSAKPLQYSCLESLPDRGARWAIVQGVAKSWT